jgi:hypothetical protein
MLLGYPLDFQDVTTLVAVCTLFARVLHWNSEDTSMARVLLKVLVEDPLEVPRDVVIKMGHESNGEGCIWMMPIYIFNSEAIMAGPLDEEDPPENNDEPLPFHGPVIPRERQQVAGLVDQFTEEVLQHNPFPVVAALDQGSNMGSLTQNMENNSVEVILDCEMCRKRMQSRQVVLALHNQEAYPSLIATGISSAEPLS